MGASISTSLTDSFLSSISATPEPFVPTSEDIQEALELLTRPRLLPPELALVVLDYAEYWTQEVAESRRHLGVRSSPTGDIKSLQILVTPPIAGVSAGVERCVRRVSVTLESRDQGFSDFPQWHGTREGSNSWFEIALIRPSSSLTSPPDSASEPPPPPIPTPATTFRTLARTEVIRNLHALRTFSTATVAFSFDDNIVNMAEKGDRYVVFAYAQFIAWSNEVRGCKVVVECAV